MRNVDVSAELTRLGIEFVPRAEGEYRIKCPFHDDTVPSCDVSVRYQTFLCRSCNKHGTIVELLCRLGSESRHIVLARLALGGDEDRPVETSVVERYAKRIWSAKSLLEELRKRGINDDTIKTFRLGETEGRISIPIPNAFGVFINIRKYLPGAIGGAKFMNIKGRSGSKLYPYSQLRFDKILYCGGEIKALAASQILNQHGIGAISCTSGETNWQTSYEELFVGKQVWVCLDIDKTGVMSAAHHCKRLASVAQWIGNVELPLDIKKYPHGDLNDFIADGGDLLSLLSETPRWIDTKVTAQIAEETAEPRDVSLREAMSADMVMQRFRTNATVSAIVDTAYFLPKDVVPVCNKDQTMCMDCPVFVTEPGTKFTIPIEDSCRLSMMDSGNEAVREEIFAGLRMPSCPVVTLERHGDHKVFDARMQRAINLTEQDSDRTSVPAVIVGQDIELNETYEVIGKAVPHPKTQVCVAIVSKATPIADALTDFKLTEPETLSRFVPKEWTLEGLDNLLNPFYAEMALNVTHIYERSNLHALIDLTYHSVLGITVSNKLKKGWVETLIIGDSAQGKTDTAQNMLKYYGLGDWLSCKNATPAGVIGGMEQIQGKWYVQWGVMPTNDRKLVVMEELKGLPHETFIKFTDMRSSGIAELQKIVRSKAQARTRLICLSNPPKDKSMASYGYGVNAVMDLIRSPEDIRRFDACMILNKDDIPVEVINEHREEVTPTFTREQCRKLILWCWTLTPEQINIAPDAMSLAISETQKLCTEYTENIPIIDRGDTRNKILRLAAGLAGRTFSTSQDDDLDMLIRKCHVEWVVRFLRTEYSSQSSGYAELSVQSRKRGILSNDELLKTAISTIPNMQQTIEHILFAERLDVNDLQNWTGWDLGSSQLFLGKLVRNNAVLRNGGEENDKYYTKTPSFTALLQSLIKTPIVLPKHIVEARKQY